MSKRLTETAKCETCRWRKGSGLCYLDPRPVFTAATHWCSHWEHKTPPNNVVQVCMTCNYMMPDPSQRLGQICTIWKKQVMKYGWCNNWEALINRHRNLIGQEIWL